MKMIIGGERRDSVSGRSIPVNNPANGDFIDTIPLGTSEDVNIAVESAENALPKWSEKQCRERGKILFHVAEEVRKNHKEIALLLTIEVGKPIRESIDEIRGFANILEYYCSLASSNIGESFSLGPIGDCIVNREPIGVCGAIIPWNVPAILMGWKTAPALLMGNTLVLKPAIAAPLTVLKLYDSFENAGLPHGVLNIVTGNGEEAGRAIVRHPRIRKVTFTGDSQNGRSVRMDAAESMKHITLELGGSDAMVVWKDADINKATDGALRGRFYNCGQACLAVKRLYLHESIKDTFIGELKNKIEKLKIGDGRSVETDMGPLINVSQRSKVEDVIRSTLEKGEGTLITGGKRPEDPVITNGAFLLPTLISDIPDDARPFREEVFGPLLPVATVEDIDTAVKQANNTPFGLGASIWTHDMNVARRFSSDVKTGVIWINKHLTIPPDVPFGGIKDSGIGRENGRNSIYEYTETKSIIIGK